MRIREENCNMVLLATVALFCAVVATAVALLDPSSAPSRNERMADNRAVDQASVRVVGPAFAPNVNPRER